MKKIAIIFGAFLFAVSCSTGEWAYMEGASFLKGDAGHSRDTDGGVPEHGESSEPGGSGNTQAGRVTAGEWCDLDHWDFWSGLMTGQDFSDWSGYWKFWTNNRVAVEVTDKDGKAVSGVQVAIERAGKEIWRAVTDNLGHAECWIGMFQKEEQADPAAVTLKVNGEACENAPAITTWDCPNGVSMNRITVEDVAPAAEKADIAFIVDATGSMGDEIKFLKDDLMDILKKVEAKQGGIAFRTGALFYRDEGDDYITRASNFSSKFSTTVNFIAKQNAAGGGDYPEAVHTALEKGLQDLSWDQSAKTKIAFMLLDAPAHHFDSVISSLQKSIQSYSANGIKIIPIAASGVDKSAEFMLRFFAAATGGTYVFITNDSGIGGDHIAASVGDYKVEILNDLIIRLIEKYTD
ncbi:MAG: VWA domain-containing protein [Bacteroidales bacterium]|nr:VWA domain-containing protein [Bacteroidales bacterium]